MSVAIILALLTACIIAQAFSPYFLACADDDEDDDRDWTDEDGWVRRPGEDVREGWLP